MNKLTKAEEFIRENKLRVKKSDDANYLIDGPRCGKVYIPSELVNVFIDHLSQDIKDGNMHNYFIEKKTNPFVFFIDFDITLMETEMENHQSLIKEWTIEMMQVVKPNLGDKFTKVLVLGRDPVELGEKSFKLGYHFIFPDSKIDRSTAKLIRLLIIRQFNEKYPDKDWDKIIDECVYDSNGLRMIGCSKSAKCDKCVKFPKGKEIYCQQCNGKKKVNIGRVYYPLFILNRECEEIEEKLVESYKVNPKPIVKMSSIRCKENGIYIDETVSSSKKSPIVCGKRKIGKEEIGMMSDENHVLLSELVKKHFGKDFEIVKVKKVELDKCEMYTCYTSSKYCLNIGKEHKSQHVYFVATPNGLYQRCFCKCDTIRESGLKCKEFKSNVMPFTENELKQLFGIDKKQKQKSEYDNIPIANMTLNQQKFILNILNK